MSLMSLAVEYLLLSMIFESLRKEEKERTAATTTLYSTCACNESILPVYKSIQEWKPIDMNTMNRIRQIIIT